MPNQPLVYFTGQLTGQGKSGEQFTEYTGADQSLAMTSSAQHQYSAVDQCRIAIVAT